MWKIRRKIDRSELPIRGCAIQFTLKNPSDAPANDWLVIGPGIEPDNCHVDPGLDVDPFLVARRRALTSAWVGHTSFAHEIAGGTIALIGHAPMARSLTKWLVRSSFASTSPAPTTSPHGPDAVMARQAAGETHHRRRAGSIDPPAGPAPDRGCLPGP